jgi:enterochelin esterase-like enzyme
MTTRQAITYISTLFVLVGFSACSANEVPPAPTPLPATPTITATSGVPSPTPTVTPLACLTQPGRVEQRALETTVPPQEFIIYMPPCYEYSTERYPVLYLLHGQTFRQDQWPRIGAPKAADMLIHSGQALPFIMVYPDDRYWNTQAGATFGARVVYNLIPYVDANYQTIADRKFRALGGLSRGGGWTAKLGFDRPDLFGALGFHSPALFKDNAPYLDAIIKNIPEENRPRLWHDIGDADTELGSSLLFEAVLVENDYLHEFYRFTGDHTEGYWNEHVEQYLRWYVKVWRENLAGQ